MSWILKWLAPSFRSPSGLSGWLAMLLMERANPASIRTGIERLDVQPNHVVCEIGAGHGFGLRHIVETFAPSRVVCVEISEDFRNKLRAVKEDLEHITASSTGEVRPKIEIHGDDARDMSAFLDSGSVDRIFAMNVVYFLDPLETYLEEIFRVLRRHGGTIVFGCHFEAVKDRDALSPTFINTEESRIVELMTRSGLQVTTTKIDLGRPDQDYVELKGVKS